ncbi:MAG: J domain-containing protein [Bacteroidia bacterium]
MPKDYHKILGISPHASREEIVKAFRKKALAYHPDKNSSADAKEKFQEISLAYRILLKNTRVNSGISTSSDFDPPKNNFSEAKKHRGYQAPKTSEERSERIKKAKQLAKEKVEKERVDELIYHQQFKKSIRYKISVICAVLCILTGTLLTIDYVMPYAKQKTIIEEQLLKVEKSKTLEGLQSEYQNTIVINKQKLILNGMDFFFVQKGDSVIVEKTHFFHDIMNVSVLNNGKIIAEERPSESVYSVAALLLLLPFFNFILEGPTMRYHFVVIFNLIVPNIALIYALLENNRLFRLFGG